MNMPSITMTVIRPILDANFNRIAEGLRVIEEYARFIAHHKQVTDSLAQLRHDIGHHSLNHALLLTARNTAYDQRANMPPPPRENWSALLRANFSRVTEALRVLEEYTSEPCFTQYRYHCYDLEKRVVLTLLKPSIETGIYLISDEPEILLNGIQQGAVLIQLRDKVGSKASLLEKAYAIKKMAIDKPFIVNDYVDIAIACDADGVHTGQDDLPIGLIRDQLGPHKLIGRTCHCLAQAQQAQQEGADYVSLGPVYETPSKPGRAAVGVAPLEQALERLQIPYVAIGGINQTTITAILPYTPPLIGIIRDHAHVACLTQQMRSYS